ncbi:MAG: hypothetical protein H8D82_01860 [Euryarchaeota archaeon]|nr:hypothetical protein [Euryarchaeota archaeon]
MNYTADRFKGTISGPAEFGSDELASAGDFDIFVWKGLIEDDDDDRIANEDDDCPDVWGNATIEPYIGCLDTDGDGYADVDDSHPLEPSQWRDTDGDGFGDNSNGFEADNCTTIFGNSTVDRIGCEDSDGDGWSNVRDAFPTEFTQWNDSDGDLFGDNWNDDELTPNFGTLDLGQYVQGAVRMDLCPTLFGLDTLDNPGCPDTDLDGWSDVTDEFPNNPTQHEDSDGDGWGDNYSAGSTQSDYLPDDETQYQDRDGDGWGDDSEGNNPDEFPDDETQHTDIDDDGWGDNISGNNPDSCPDTWGDSWRDRFGCPDVDGDGTSDEGDTFPSDWSQWTDSDADGRGDNWANPHWNETRLPHWPGEYIPGATNSDKHPLDKDGDGWEDENASGQQPWDDCVDEPGDSWQDRFGCPDRDGDGWSDDNDAFDDDVTQWRDSDRDGFGDENGGINGDDCPTVRGDSENDRIGCPDTDTDGWSDPMDNLAPYPWNASQGADLFPADPARWNKTHEISESNSQAGDGGLAAGLGLGALIALMFVMVFAILIVKLRQNEEDDYYDDEDEDETEAISRAADIARSWQDHGVAPPPPPDGAELVTAASEVLENTQGTLDNSHQSYVAPPPPTAANTLDNPSGHFQDGDSIPQVIPAAPAPPDSPMSNDGGVMSGMDTNLAMSLLGSSSGGEETKSPDEVEEPVSEVGESGGDVSESRSEAEKAESEVSESALTPTASESVDNSADETQNQPAETAETWADDDDPWA